VNTRATLRAWLLLCMLGAGACEGTETGNPDLATGGVGAHPSIGEGGRGSDGGASSDAGVTVRPDGGRPPSSSDAGLPEQDGGIGADFDGGVTDPRDDDAGR
jgi:hypothetical protein